MIFSATVLFREWEDMLMGWMDSWLVVSSQLSCNAVVELKIEL